MEFIVDDYEILEVKETSLDEWLELICEPPAGKIFVRNMFPTDAHRNEWFRTAHLRPESDVKLLLRHFLVSTGSNPMDRFDARRLISDLQNGAAVDELEEHDRRLLFYVQSRGKYPVWEGLGWVIDLLPQHPRMALNVIDAFFQAYYDRLTDNYLSGLFDAQAIIRNRYIESSHTADHAIRVLLGLNWRELELLCGVAYEHMGFHTIVTPRGDDDGVDVFAANHVLGQTGLVVIQAKKWNDSNPVGKGEVRELLGTIILHSATKGVLVTTGRFEAGALKMAEKDPRIELLGREQILQLLNEHCGADWFVRVDRLITIAKVSERATERGPDASTVSQWDND
jgi:restriction system protein